LTAGPKLKTAIARPQRQAHSRGRRQIYFAFLYALLSDGGQARPRHRREDVDGNEFFDFSAGIAVTSTGHCHPEVVAAIQKQAGELIHMSGTDFYYESMVTLAERLSKIAPMPGPHKIYYGNSGAEAVECALKLARYHTKRQHMIAFFGAFHGRTMGALSLTASKPQQKRRFAPLVPGVTHVRYPDVYRGCQAAAGCREVRARLRALHRRQAVQDHAGSRRSGGDLRRAGPGRRRIRGRAPVFMQELRRICDKHGILLVVDEVQSGIGRTGKWWAVEHTGVQPDIVCMAKGIASGMPLGVMMSKRRHHGLGSRLARLDLWRQSGLHRRRAGDARRDRKRRPAANSAEVGNHMLKRMADWPKKHKLVGDVRGRGLMIGVEIVKDKKTKEYAADERDRIVELAFERGVLFLGCGPSTVRISPPLVVTKDEADDVLDEVLSIVEKGK
jgi:4-aminobutyrate aminotransferase